MTQVASFPRQMVEVERMLIEFLSGKLRHFTNLRPDWL